MSADEDGPWPAWYFEGEGNVFVPTRLARSPWDASAVAGGPLGGLLASVVEDPALDENFDVARFQVDIFGKVPREPLTIAVEALRDARQTKMHRATMLAGGRIVAQAHVLRVRRLAAPVVAEEHDYPEASSVPVFDIPEDQRMGGAMTLRKVIGHPGLPGRAVVWLGLNCEVIKGQQPTPFVKACFFADFGSGFGNATDPAEWSYANLDITLQFLRPPKGEWLLIDAQTQMAGNGYATARAIFADQDGIYARALQTVFVAPGYQSVDLPAYVGS